VGAAVTNAAGGRHTRPGPGYRSRRVPQFRRGLVPDVLQLLGYVSDRSTGLV